MATIKLTGMTAIDFAREKGLTLNQTAGAGSGTRYEVSPSDAEEIADGSPDSIWLEASLREYAHYLMDAPLDSLTSIGDAETIMLWRDLSLELVNLTHQDFALRYHEGERAGHWQLIQGRDALLESIISALNSGVVV